MAMLFITLGFMLLVVTIMAVGVILGRKPIQGSCGGMSALGMETACDICGGDTKICEEESKKVAASANTSLAYNAAEKK